MIVKGEAFSRRLEGFSTDTMRLISQLDHKYLLQALDIAAETDYSETEVVQRIVELIKPNPRKA